MENNVKKSFAYKLLLSMFIVLLLVVVMVMILDPYYHYHKPLFGMKAVLYEPEYQVIGSIHNFDYDGIILGSSVAENFDNDWFDKAFNCKTIKGIRKSGTTAYLTYFLDEAFRTHNLRYVFYSLDTSALLADCRFDLEEDGMPVYLYDKNFINDINYIFNKDVIFEKIPYMLVQNLSSSYKEGEAYNWAKYKSFSREIALSNYIEPEEVIIDDETKEKYMNNIENNITAITARVISHPETQFIFWIPPYSSLWHKSQQKMGEYEISLYAIEMAKSELTKYENVKFYSFIDDAEVTDNLDNYMDPIHYSQEINYYIFNVISQ